MDDMAYRNSSDNFILDEPAEQSKQKAKEIGELVDISPRLKQIIEAYEQRIAERKSPQAFSVDFGQDIQAFERQCYALQESVKYLEADKEWFKDMLITLESL